MDKKRIRNFSIIAHIDHGKSTLADRILEFTNSITIREQKDQILDTMELERERGITIKLNVVQVEYKNYVFNLIDTPGHIDFSYEVSRSLAASEGAILLVDATQGVQPQTVANTYLAMENNLVILPVINKIDVEYADVDKTKKQIKESLAIDATNAVGISAKMGVNIEQVLEQIIEKIPYPKHADDDKPLQALIFDAYYDPYKGVVAFVKVFQGIINAKDSLRFIRLDKKVEVISVGVNKPKETKREMLTAGETGWIVINEKNMSNINLGDTLTKSNLYDVEALKGYKPSKPMVFSGFYPVDTNKYLALKDAIGKISLSDSSLVFQKESSNSLGFGFRIGFLGILHLEIIQERLEREFNIDIIATNPSVIYKLTYKNTNKIEMVSNPSKFPSKDQIKYVEEPYINMTIFCPKEYIGKIMEYLYNNRGIYKDLKELTPKTSILIFDMPLSEMVFNFSNNIKSISKGYASFDYKEIGYKKGNLIKLDILLAGEKVDSLSLIVDANRAYLEGRQLCLNLKDLIPRQNFEIAIQAMIGGKIIARESIRAYRKDVTGHLYGGDISRKKKLLQKQKKGKKKAKLIGRVEIPKKSFIAIMKSRK